MLNTNRFTELTAIEFPLIQAPMAGASGSSMAAAVSASGALGSLPCALHDPETVRSEYALVREQTDNALNMNFFCHKPPRSDSKLDDRWRKTLDKYYQEFDLNPNESIYANYAIPFDEEMCKTVIDLQPAVVSFHFGLPDSALVDRVRSAGCKILSSATTVDEAIWLEDHGVDAVIAQGVEAGGHRGMFLNDDITLQTATFSLLPRVVDAVKIPVIAAGGIGDSRVIAAALALGASAVQIGTAYLYTNESLITPLHRAALSNADKIPTALTNLFSGRPARSLMNRIMHEIGPMSNDAPVFPTAGAALSPLKAIAEKNGSADFSSLWAGQAASISYKLTQALAADAGTSSIDAEHLTRHLWSGALQEFSTLSEFAT